MDGSVGLEDYRSLECRRHLLVSFGWLHVSSDKIKSHKGVDIKTDPPEEEEGIYLIKKGGGDRSEVGSGVG